MLDQKKVWFVHNYTLNGNEVTLAALGRVGRPQLGLSVVGK